MATQLVKKELEPPEAFPFPFTPYDIQKDFMRELYLTLERGQVGIFESPTGTGKSLSIICGAVKWLLDREERDSEHLQAVLEGKLPATSLQQQLHSPPTTTTTNTESEGQPPDWLTAYKQQKAEREALQSLREEVQRRERREAKLKKLREEIASSRWRQRIKRDNDLSVSAELAAEEGVAPLEDADLLVADYNSEEETVEELKSSDSEEEVEEEDAKKIYYCSRTHTQLAQFVREVQKSPYAERIRVVTLGSRQNLCVNPEVTRLKSLTLMNDRCLEMQKKKKSTTAPKERTQDGEAERKQRRKTISSASCPFYKPAPLMSFRDLALAKVQDIEELVSVGKDLKACPYYGTRQAVPSAQLVVLPYNTLLHAPTREAVGIRLKGNVVIIDEAHNLLETISSVYSVQIRGPHVAKAYSQLSQYMNRYRSRLKAKNLLYINQLLLLLNCFIKVLQGPTGSSAETKLVRLNDFLFSSKIDNINIFKVLNYCEKSQISRKLNGFVDRYFEDSDPKAEHSAEGEGAGGERGTGGGGGTVGAGGVEATRQMNSPLMLVEAFLRALTNTDKDGRIVITRAESLSGRSLKFLLLNPSVHFTQIVREASAVVVAGGTMQPSDEFKDQLLSQAGIGPQQIVEFTCGHVIPPDQLLPLVLCKGPGGTDLEFTYQTRDREKIIEELGRSLVNLSTIVPGGLVCFFPSYEYEKKVHAHWEKTGILSRITQRKKLFREPKLSSQVDTVLTQYARHIERCVGREERTTGGQNGALLLSVVGGKLSEGINFSDDLGRCVVMIGLPYPNITSPELKEKIDYLNSTLPRQSDGRLPGQVHYESLCMRAVNQSIGRAIRHSRDYACIVLADMRYEKPSVAKHLPKWIAGQLQVCKSFGQGFAAVRKFFNKKPAVNSS